MVTNVNITFIFHKKNTIKEKYLKRKHRAENAPDLYSSYTFPPLLFAHDCLYQDHSPLDVAMFQMSSTLSPAMTLPHGFTPNSNPISNH